MKGRDLWDLIWYLSDPEWPPPNLVLLNSALAQSGWDGPEITEEAWRDAVLRRLEAVVWDDVVADARPFLESSADSSLLMKETLLHLLR